MNEDIQQLKAVLQILALPVLGQVRLVEDDCDRVDLLAAAFNTAHLSLRDGGDLPFTREQVAALTRLDDQLARLRDESSSPLCSELALRTSHDWRQIRLAARVALARFNWKIAIPSEPLLEKEPCLN